MLILKQSYQINYFKSKAWAK